MYGFNYNRTFNRRADNRRGGDGFMIITLQKIDEFLADRKLKNIFNSENTVRTYRGQLVAWAEYSSENGFLDDSGSANRYLQHLAAIGRGSKTVKTTLYILKSFYDWLGGDQNPFSDLAAEYRVSKKETAAKKLERDHRVYSADDVGRLLNHARGKIGNQSGIDYYLAYRNWFMIYLLSEYGMRISGLMGVNVNHIKFETRCMTIYDSKNQTPYPVPLKTSLTAVRSYLAVRGRIMGEIPNVKKALFLSHTGKRLSDTSARRAINDLAAEIGLYDAGRSTHQLRHYRATRYFADGMPLDLISIVMGVSVPVLKSTYLHLTETDTVKQYETWLDHAKTGHFVCPRCGYGDNEKVQDRPVLRVIE